MAIEFSERIGRLPSYPAAGGYADAAPPVRLASNESPWSPLPAVREAIERALGSLNRYPDPTSAALRGRLSDRYGVPVGRIAIGNGSCDILLAAGEALLEPGAELVYAWPSFSVYPHLSAASGAREVRVPLDEYERHDLPAMLREITVATRLVIICNPNNPTSTAVALAEIAAFLDEVPPHVCVILDEAYCEFNLLEDPDATLDLLAVHPNLVLLRTFSKVHGLCGCASASPCAARSVSQVGRSGARTILLQRRRAGRGVEALAHQDAVTERVARTVAERIGRRAVAGAWPTGRRVAGQLLLVSPRARQRRAGGYAWLARARRARAWWRRARAGRRAARHIWDGRGEPQFSGCARRSAVKRS